MKASNNYQYKMSTIQLSETLSLCSISMSDVTELQQLMHRIYPPAYKHLWEDDGQWYVEETFNETQLRQELADSNGYYYFVKFKEETIGILRIIHEYKLEDVPDLKATKLHRIYLDPKTHGKAIGTLLMDWLTEQARQNNSQMLWLEAMDTQEQALHFYKKRGYKISSDFRLTFELMHPHLRGMHTMYKLL